MKQKNAKNVENVKSMIFGFVLLFLKAQLKQV